MIYGYARVSSKDQNLDRQLAQLKLFGVEEKNIFKDKESGKNFERKNYIRLRARLRPGDLVVIKSIDRLGRDYDMILEEWAFLTKTLRCDIKVLDMDLLDTRAGGNNLIGRFIADLVLQILSFVAETERASIRQRQSEGIEQAKLKGVKFGRPGMRLSSNFRKCAEMYRRGELNLEHTLELVHMSRGSFYKYYKQYLREVS